jgi:hypothetical protein
MTLRSARRLGRVRPRLRAALALIIGMTAGGCYTFVPVDTVAPEQGTIVRADLTPAGEQGAISRFGPGIREVHGMALEAENGMLSLLVDAVAGRQGTVRVDPEPFRLESGFIATLYERRISTMRTVLFGAGLIGGAFLLVEGFKTLDRHFDSDDVGPPGPQDLRLPGARPSGIRIRPGW